MTNAEPVALPIALRYAAAGQKVIPLHTATPKGCSCGKPSCHSIGKHPRTPKGAYDASSDPAIIEAWFKRWPDANLGMTLDGYVAIDVDPRHNGTETLELLLQKHGALPDTWTQRTGGGGLHYVFRADPKAKYAGHLGAGVDLKHGSGQFIVVEPSQHASGGSYNWLDETGPIDGSPVADAPAWLSQASAAADNVVIPGPNSEKIGAGQRNSFLYERARRLRDLSFRQPEILMALGALNTRCVPPLTEDELYTISKSASQHEPELKGVGHLFIDAAAFTANITPPVWLVESIIQRSFLYALTATTNHGKTALACSLSLAVATGANYAGHETEPGHVLYLCGENPEDFKLRIKGTMQAMNIAPDAVAKNLTILPVTQRLSDLHDSINAFANTKPISLVIVDTSVAYFSYEDENDNMQTKLHAQDLRNLIALPGSPAVLTLCHPVKNPARDNLVPRGGSAFLNEIDCNLTAFKEDDVVELHHTKVRGPGFEPVQFKLVKQEILGLHDHKGRPVHSIAAQLINETEAYQASKTGSKDIDDLLQAMRYEAEGSISAWARRCGWLTADGLPQKSKVHRLLDKLKASHFVKNELNEWKLTDKGESRAKQALK